MSTPWRELSDRLSPERKALINKRIAEALEEQRLAALIEAANRQIYDPYWGPGTEDE